MELLPENLVWLNRTNPADLRAFVAEVRKPARPQRVQRASARSSYADLEVAWDAELERVAPGWQEGKRQYLALALSRYGLFDLGLPVERVERDVLELARQKGDPEIGERHRAIIGTYEKMQRGEPVSRNNWYEKAGLELPGKPAPSPEVLRILEDLETWILSMAHIWHGSGLTDRRVLLIAIAKQHGTLRDNGVEVSLSQRDLALRAGITLSTANKSLKRSKAEGRIQTWRAAHKGDAGSIILSRRTLSNHPKFRPAKRPISKTHLMFRSRDQHSTIYSQDQAYARLRHSYKGSRKSDISKVRVYSMMQPILFSQYGLGSLASLVLGTLNYYSGRATSAQLAYLTERATQQLDRPLAHLIDTRLVRQEGREYVPVQDLEAALQRAVEEKGLLEIEAERQAQSE